MKNFLLIFILFVSISTYAQNYRTANITETNYYEDSTGSTSTIFPFKVANFNAQTNGDILINFMETFNGGYDSTGFCIDTASIGWQGEKVLLEVDGTDIYYTINDEPISIKTQANIGDTWLFYDENIRFEATLLQIGTQAIFGIMENVKTFTIQAIDGIYTLQIRNESAIYVKRFMKD